MDLTIKVMKIAHGYTIRYKISCAGEENMEALNYEEQKKDIEVFEKIKQCLSNFSDEFKGETGIDIDVKTVKAPQYNK